MSGLRPISSRKLLRVLVRRGFHVVSKKGSHVKLRDNEGRIVIVPVHPGKDIRVGLLARILNDAGIETRTFLDDV